jgi:DNA-binding MarR family transcriptional regulator
MMNVMLEKPRSADFERLATAAEDYVLRAFGVKLDLAPLLPKGLPHFVKDQYRFWRGTLLGQPAILMAVTDTRSGTGATANFIKHRELIKRDLGASLVLMLLDRTTAAIRRQLVDRKVGFLAPGAQLYIPEAFLDLRERERSNIPSAPDKELLSPTAQTLVLGALLGLPIDNANLTELAERFGVAVMSVSRALDELEAHGIAKAKRIGRQRRLHFTKGSRDLWRAAEPLLQSPVRATRTLVGERLGTIGQLAGESALAHDTMLAPPRVQRWALPAARWKEVSRDLELKPATSFDDARFEIETWSYDPRVLAPGATVDPLSLYLTVRNHADERVAQAADQLLEQFEW